MKMHFCIPVSQQRPDALGGRYTVRGSRVPAGQGRRGRRGSPAAGLTRPRLCLQLYSVYLDGLLFCRVRYSQLRRWHEQVSERARAGPAGSPRAGEERAPRARGLWARKQLGPLICRQRGARTS